MEPTEPAERMEPSPERHLSALARDEDGDVLGRWRAGDLVLARYHAQRHGPARTAWYPGTVGTAHDGGACDISYDDGDCEKRVPAEYIKAASGAAADLGAQVVCTSCHAAAMQMPCSCHADAMHTPCAMRVLHTCMLRTCVHAAGPRAAVRYGS